MTFFVGKRIDQRFRKVLILKIENFQTSLFIVITRFCSILIEIVIFNVESYLLISRVQKIREIFYYQHIFIVFSSERYLNIKFSSEFLIGIYEKKSTKKYVRNVNQGLSLRSSHLCLKTIAFNSMIY